MWSTLLSNTLWCCLLLPAIFCGAQEESAAAADSEASRSVSSLLGDGEEVTGRSSSSISTHVRLNLVCDTAVARYQSLLHNTELNDVYSAFKKDLQEKRVGHFFHSKIVPNHQGAVCQNLNVTCCKPSMEKSAETLSRNEYMFYYDEIFQSHSQICQSPGKRFHYSSFLVIRQLKEELEARVNLTLGMTLPLNTFQDFTNFLASFSGVPNLCRLPDLLDSQSRVLIDLMLTSILGGEEDYTYILRDPELLRCARNISSSLIGNHQKRLMADLQKHLVDLSLLSQTLKLAHETVEAMRNYRFSQSCVTALTRMRYCPMCGGYTKFKPCLFMCINTFRGCFADLAEIQSDFLGLISAARVLSDDIIREMGPETFDKSYFNNFVLMMQELRQKEEYLKETVVLECSDVQDQNSTNTLTRRKRGGSLIQPIQGSKSRPKLDPLLEQLDTKVLSTVVEVEMGCLEMMADKMKDAADDICHVSKYEVAHKGNSQCWTGSVLGRYDHPKVGFMKADQMRNPEYVDIPQTTGLRYSKLIDALRTTTRRINNTIALNKICLDSDDEDCFRNPFQNCRRKDGEESTPTPGSGSGSGSDSGINETATEDNRDDDATSRPTTVATVQSTANAIPSDNKLRDEMIPTMPATTRATTSTTTPNSGVGDFDNAIPIGSKDRVSVPDREPISTNPASTARTTTRGTTSIGTTSIRTTTPTADTATEVKITVVTTTATMTTDAMTTEDTSDIGHGETTLERELPTMRADIVGEESLQTSEPLVISSSAPPHCTPLLLTALATCLAFGILH